MGILIELRIGESITVYILRENRALLRPGKVVLRYFLICLSLEEDA
jgi:hypothetical protein